MVTTSSSDMPSFTVRLVILIPIAKHVLFLMQFHLLMKRINLFLALIIEVARLWAVRVQKKLIEVIEKLFPRSGAGGSLQKLYGNIKEDVSLIVYYMLPHSAPLWMGGMPKLIYQRKR